MSRRFIWVAVAVGTVVAAVIAAIVIFTRSGYDEPDDFIADTYTRAPSLDQPNNGRAYTATRVPKAVADEITAAVAALDRRTTGNLIYLQYREHIIAISPHSGGTKILVDDYRTGHRRHRHHTSAFGWAAGSPGDDFRGGGSSDGK
ncbi:DUF4247 domain-containing protein [Nocardia donostiensis]|uniref:DUF4247 domain-containing protein n=1 Tax=Nocardia donostiensis TaxID=1538463 RepID=A0A1V2TKK6_9NOCA|nr:DUF4247 domain-containing protein [Nocardia donostiensis]ONM50067.1 hypothetical protein B0T46_02925 [Nocardia donostiensis]OQS19433.1 hypothetical protein B0T44_14660 [Nocardia donostiensis]